FARGEHARAEALQREALEVARRGAGENSGQYAQQADGLALLYQALGRPAEAEPLLRGNLELVRRAGGGGHAAPAPPPAPPGRAALCRGRGDDASAEPLYREALGLLRKDPPTENRPLSGLLNNLALLHLARGAAAQAEPLLRQALENDREALGEDHPDHAN